MKKLTAKSNVVRDIFAVLSNTSPKELEAVKDTDVIRTMTRFAKLTDKMELPETKAADAEKAAIGKAIRAEVKPLIDGKTAEETEEIAKPFNEKLVKAFSDIDEKYELNTLDERETSVELSDDEHALLKEVLPLVGKAKFNAVKPFAAALSAVEDALELEK